LEAANPGPIAPCPRPPGRRVLLGARTVPPAGVSIWMD
jgi:hypothetical protein